MEIKEAAERVVIAKPVASKPSCSTLRSFSELLAGAINDSSPPGASLSDTAVAAIRPKTVRVTKPAPTTTQASAGAICSQSHSQIGVSKGAASGLAQSLDTLLASDTKSTVLYKPLAKLVSKSTVSLLANMGNFNASPPQAVVAPVEQPQPQQLSRPQGRYIKPTQNGGTLSEAEPSRIADTSGGQHSSQNTEDDSRSVSAVANVDRPSYDGYNWRKYGQKQVKGSEYPRSYYKCTHPNCPVKKKVERSFDGQITEIVYKGEHNHSKPEPQKKNTPAGISQVNESEGAAQDFSAHFVNDARHQMSDQEQSGMMRPSVMLTYEASNLVPSFDNVVNAGLVMLDNSCRVSTDHDDGSKGIDADDDEPRSKRRKSEVQGSDQAGPSAGERMQVPNIVVQSSTDNEIVGDGYRWRKYGQKVVKGNPYPRSYYRCTSPKCNVRKHVEQASEDPKSLITTYEGKHNHDMPSRSAAQAVSEQGSQQTKASKDRK